MEPIDLSVSSIPSEIFNINNCIICQEDTAEALISKPQGRKRIRECAEQRQDKVTKRLKLLVEDTENFVYHMSNDCYKNYTLKKTVQSISQQIAGSSTLSQTQPEEHTIQSKRKSREPPTQQKTYKKKVYNM